MTGRPTDSLTGSRKTEKTADHGEADTPTSEIHLHPAYAQNLQQATRELTAAYQDMRSAALDLIDQQIARLATDAEKGDGDMLPALSTLVIARLAEPRVRLLAIDPTKPEAGIELTALVNRLQELVSKPVS